MLTVDMPFSLNAQCILSSQASQVLALKTRAVVFRVEMESGHYSKQVAANISFWLNWVKNFENLCKKTSLSQGKKSCTTSIMRSKGHELNHSSLGQQQSYTLLGAKLPLCISNTSSNKQVWEASIKRHVAIVVWACVFFMVMTRFVPISKKAQ